jgi:hypothetical protein
VGALREAVDLLRIRFAALEAERDALRASLERAQGEADDPTAGGRCRATRAGALGKATGSVAGGVNQCPAASPTGVLGRPGSSERLPGPVIQQRFYRPVTDEPSTRLIGASMQLLTDLFA